MNDAAPKFDLTPPSKDELRGLVADLSERESSEPGRGRLPRGNFEARNSAYLRGSAHLTACPPILRGFACVKIEVPAASSEHNS
jgi:hypothetical protein